MIRDLISNIIQNSAGSSSEHAQNQATSDQLKSEFSSLLNSMKKENVSTQLINEDANNGTDQNFTSAKDEGATSNSEESLKKGQLIVSNQVVQQLDKSSKTVQNQIIGSASSNVDIQAGPQEIVNVEADVVSENAQSAESQINNNKIQKGSIIVEPKIIGSEISQSIELAAENPTSNKQVERSELVKSEQVTHSIKQESEALISASQGVSTHSSEIVSSQKLESDAKGISVDVNGSHQQINSSGTADSPISKIKDQKENIDGNNVREGSEFIKTRTQATDKANRDRISSNLVSQIASPELSEALSDPQKMVQTITTNQIEQKATQQANVIPPEFTEGKNRDLIQFIQTHKSEVIKPKEAKEQRFALSMTEQAETRLKLLVDSVRPEILSTREAPVGFITTHSLDEKIQFFNPSLTLSNDQEAMLKELMMQSIDGKDQKATEHNLMGYLRLGELPIANATARRSLVSGFAKVMQQEMSSSATRQNEQWQKHSFKLDDANNIDMTTKNIDGVLHIKLAASNPELNRLLMSMEQEIKDHLKGELNLELDLQFDNQEQDTFSDATNDGSEESRRNWNRTNSELSEKDSTQETIQSLQPSIRNFGYNQMEWTA